VKPQRRRPVRLAMLALAMQVAWGCRLAGPHPTPSSLDPLPPAIAPFTSTSTPASRSLAASPSPPLPATWTPNATPTEQLTSDEHSATTAIAVTLSSLDKADDYPLYVMRYHGPYTLTASSAATVRWVTGRPSAPTWACSLFAALGDEQHRLYGRNFDWRYSPALLLFTDPPDGYASVSMVDIAYLVDLSKVHELTDLPLEERAVLLETPFWPFDGMNEHGLVVGMAAVPESEMPHDPRKTTIDSLLVIREMLDHARDVGEAVAILEGYNVAWGGGPPLHYLIADRAGQATLVEFYDGEMVLIRSRSASSWHLATNHLRAAVHDVGSGGCWRYEAIHRRLASAKGSLSVTPAMDLLADVAQENTQWSVVYDLGSGAVHVVLGRAYEEAHLFLLSD